MIIYPSNWKSVGQPIPVELLDKTLLEILADVDSDCLSFSGGVDSSLLLYYLLSLGRKVRTFTVACNREHPDVDYAMRVLKYMKRQFRCQIDSDVQIFTNGIHGNEAVVAYYWNLEHTRGVKSIITGDGIDEYMAGYYEHMAAPSETTYYNVLRRLQEDHLLSLNVNSGKVKVYLPYIDKRLIYLLSQIPLSEKVNLQTRKRVVLALARGKVPNYVLERRKYGLCTKSV